jgi:molybdopterin molybdotransferase
MAERGFASLASIEQARSLLIPPDPGNEVVPLAEALGRVLARDVLCSGDLPPERLAARDGYAVAAADAEGAGAYNPLPLAALSVTWGSPMPPGTDAVLPFDAVEALGPSMLNVLASIAPGEGVAAQGSMLSQGAVGARAGTVLRPTHLALLAALNTGEVLVRRRPNVALIIAGPKGSAPDVLTPMLAALIRGNGGRLHPIDGLAVVGADLLVMAGRTGLGADDTAAQSLETAGGELLLHGIAIRPGTSAGVGRLGTVPVLLLPGDPLAAVCAWHLLAAPLLRGIAGLPEPIPRLLPLRRKLVSAIGFTDLIHVRIENSGAVSAGPVDASGPALAARSDGFVVVPATLEGYAAQDRVEVFPAT